MDGPQKSIAKANMQLKRPACQADGPFIETPRNLPVSAAAVAATPAAHVSTTAESAGMAAAADAASRRSAIATAGTAAIGPRGCGIATCAAIGPGSPGVCACAAKGARSAAIAGAIAVSSAKSIPAAPVPATVVPRAGADENSAVEPLRPVIAIWGACIGVIRVIAPLADRGTVDHGSGHDCGTDPNSHLNLGICACRKGQSKEHRQQNQP